MILDGNQILFAVYGSLNQTQCSQAIRLVNFFCFLLKRIFQSSSSWLCLTFVLDSLIVTSKCFDWYPYLQVFLLLNSSLTANFEIFFPLMCCNWMHLNVFDVCWGPWTKKAHVFLWPWGVGVKLSVLHVFSWDCKAEIKKVNKNITHRYPFW